MVTNSVYLTYGETETQREVGSLRHSVRDDRMGQQCVETDYLLRARAQRGLCCLCTPSTGQVTWIPDPVAYVIQAMPQTPLVPAATSNVHGLFSLKS